MPGQCLSSIVLVRSTKLAVCTGDGSHFDKHYDNAFVSLASLTPTNAFIFLSSHALCSQSISFSRGGSDLRKLTSVYYLNPSWHETLGGLFRIYHQPPNHDAFTNIEPLSDRLIVFWCVSEIKYHFHVLQFVQVRRSCTCSHTFICASRARRLQVEYDRLGECVKRLSRGCCSS